MTEPSAAPLVALEASGQATILSYNVPEPTSYAGRNYIELPFDDHYFTAAGKVVPDRAKLANRPLTEITSVVAASLDGAADPREFPLVAYATRGLAGFASRPARTRGGTAARQWNPDTGESTDLPGPDDEDSGHHGGQHGGQNSGQQGGDQEDDPVGPGTIASHIQAGLTPVVYTSLWGTDVSTWIPTAQTAEPRLYLVEEYRLSTYLGSYGAGRVVQTMTLLPGEKTTISVKSYTQSTTTQSEASSILDSFSEQSATDFESAVESEQSDQSTYAKSFEYKAEASASWGFGMVKVGGGVAGSTNSSREEAAKNVASATEKTSASASSKRDVQINTSSEVSTEVGSETSITREISNINLSAPLNFVFRQMNQEFITILHLVDVRVAFFNNFAESKQERPLPELGALLDEVMVDDADKRQEVRAEILHALNTVADWRGQPVRDAIRQRSYPERDGSVTKVWQFNRDLVTEYEDPATGAAFTVPGVILSVQKNVMRTEGIVVEALMGVAPALDPYNTALQEEALKERRAANTAAELANRREELAQRIVSSGATNLADTYVRLFVPDPAPATDTPAPPAA